MDNNGIASRFRNICSKLGWLPAVLARVTIGYIFIQSGWGKLHHLDKVVEFFTELGIPAANIQAPFVACVEFGCGLLVLLGLFTRFASIPLIGTMVVAIFTAKMKDISELGDLFAMSEYLYIVLLLYLIVHGSGCISIDHFWCRRARNE